MSDGEVRRLHPAMALIGVLRGGASNLAAIVPAAAIGFREGFGLFFIVLALFAIPMLVLSVLRWWRFTYRIGEDALAIEQGILRRSHRSIPLDRIVDVSIEQKLLARLIGMALVRIETGGGEADEGRLDSVSLAEAGRLRAVLRSTTPVPAAEVAGAPPAREAVFAMSLERVLLHGLFSFSLWWIFAIFVVLQWIDRAMPDIDWEEVAGVAQREAQARFTVALAIEVGLVLLAAAIVLGFAAGVATTLARDFGFRLTYGEGRFQRTRGLLTRSHVALAARRIQLALVRRDWISGRLGWNALYFQTLGGGEDAGGRQEVAPFARRDEVAQVVAVAGLPAFEPDALVPVSSGHIARTAVRHGLPVLVVAGAAGLFWTPAWFGLLLVPIPVCVALLQQRHHRYGLCKSSVQVTRGVLAQQDWILPYPAVQGVMVSQTWLQRRLGIATIDVDAAGGQGPEIADIRPEEARRLALALMERSAA